MGRVTWRGVRRHPIRFVLSVLAVVLGIAFVSGTFSLRTMLGATFDEIVDKSLVADVYVQGAGESDSASDLLGETSPSLIPADLTKRLARVPGIDRALPDVSGPMILVGADGTAVTSGNGAPNFAMATWPDDPGFDVAVGRAPAQAGEIALEASTLDRSGLTVGDRATVILGGEVTTQRIVGSLAFDAPMAGATAIALDERTAMGLYAPDGLVPAISVYATPGTDPTALAERIRAVVPADAHAKVATGAERRAASKEAIADQLGFIPTFLLIFAGIALFVGAFIIFNTFQMVVRQRLRETAVLRALGASPSQVFASVLGQAAVVGLVGAALGVFAGLGLIEILRAIFDGIGMELAGSVPLEVGSVLLALAFGVGVAVAAAAVPAWHAARVPPVEAMREAPPARRRTLARFGVVGAVLLAGGVAAVGAALGGVGNDEVLLGIGAVAVLLGAVVIAPAAAGPAVRVLAWPFVALFRPIGRLARGNAVRNPMRTATTSGALMVGMALVGAASVLAASVQTSMATVVDDSMVGDYILGGVGTDGIPAGAIEAVRKAPDVARVDTMGFAALAVDDEQLPVGMVTPGAFVHSLTLDPVEGDIAAFDAGEALVKRGDAERHGWRIGDVVTLTQPAVPGRAPQEIRVGAIVDTPAFDVPIIVPQPVVDALAPENLSAVTTVMVTAKEGSAETLRGQLAAAVKPYLVVSVQDRDEFTSSLTKQVNQMLYILYALLGLSIVIAIIGIVNTLALSILERTREIGLSRAVGLGRLQLAGSVTIESVLIAVSGAIAGLAVGVGLAATLPTILEEQGFTALTIPWPTIAGMVAAAVLVGAVAAIAPATRAVRLPVLEAVADE